MAKATPQSGNPAPTSTANDAVKAENPGTDTTNKEKVIPEPVKDPTPEQKTPDQPMTDEQIRKALEAMPVNQREALEKYFAKDTQAQPDQVKQPEMKTPLEDEDDKLANNEHALHLARLHKYGENYMVVQKPAGVGQKMMQKVFSAHAWKNLGPADKSGAKEGWKPAVKTPPEVKNLQTKK